MSEILLRGIPADVQRRLCLHGHVPDFNVHAKGLPSAWHAHHNNQVWNRRLALAAKKSHDAAEQRPDISDFISFLGRRKDKCGNPIQALFDKPQLVTMLEGDWYRFPWIAFSDAELPTTSQGGLAYELDGKASWVTAWHGIRMEALYSICFHGFVKASCSDGDRGERTHTGVTGVYCFSDERQEKAADQYAVFVDLLRTEVYWRAVLELRVDRSARVPMASRRTDQWVQPQDSVRLVALCVEGRLARDMVEGQHWISRCWDPLAEANPGLLWESRRGKKGGALACRPFPPGAT